VRAKPSANTATRRGNVRYASDGSPGVAISFVRQHASRRPRRAKIFFVMRTKNEERCGVSLVTIDRARWETSDIDSWDLRVRTGTPKPRNVRRHRASSSETIGARILLILFLRRCFFGRDGCTLSRVLYLFVTPKLLKWALPITLCDDPDQSRRSYKRQRYNRQSSYSPSVEPARATCAHDLWRDANPRNSIVE
jgi:hypothetical protein